MVMTMRLSLAECLPGALDTGGGALVTTSGLGRFPHQFAEMKAEHES